MIESFSLLKTNSNKNAARIAGLLYLIIAVNGFFFLRYVPSKLIAWDNGSTTFNNLINSEQLFRLSILSEIIAYTAWVLLPLVLYKLLKPVNKTCAIFMVVFALLIVPVAFCNIQNQFAVLTLINKASFLKVVEPAQLQANVLFYLNSYDNGNLIASIFWGIWLLPFGYLVYMSGFLPKVLGILLMFGCFGYLINFIGNLLFSQYGDSSFARIITKPGSIGELGICLWLLIIGAKETKQQKLTV
jgi:hypothetical protein